MDLDYSLEDFSYNEDCVYLMFLNSGNNKCYISGKKCKMVEYYKKCKKYLHVSNIQSVFPKLTDIPQLLLNKVIENSVLNIQSLVCHHLSRVLKIYFKQLPEEVLYRGKAYRLTNSIEQEKRLGDFFNFSKEVGGYNGAYFEGCGQSSKGRKYEGELIGVDMVKFVEKYYTEKNSQVLTIVNNEALVMGKIPKIVKKI